MSKSLIQNVDNMDNSTIVSTPSFVFMLTSSILLAKLQMKRFWNKLDLTDICKFVHEWKNDYKIWVLWFSNTCIKKFLENLYLYSSYKTWLDMSFKTHTQQQHYSKPCNANRNEYYTGSFLSWPLSSISRAMTR